MLAPHVAMHLGAILSVETMSVMLWYTVVR